MRVKLLTLRYSSSLGVIDDRPLDRLLCGKEVLDVREHLFLVQGVRRTPEPPGGPPYLALV